MRRLPGFNVGVAAFVALAFVPAIALALREPYAITFLSRVLIFGMAALSLNLILGFGGMTSLGHAAFMGVGAYTVGLLMHHGVTSGYLHFGAAIAIGALAALAIGAVCLRTGGLSFIMLTLASAQLLFFVGSGLKQYGGDDGFSFRGRSQFGPWFSLADEATLYWFILGWLAFAALIVQRCVDSHFGLALRGLKSNEARAVSVGLPVYRHKLIAFAISGTLCSVSGALLANLSQFVSPSYMHWSRSAELLLMVLLGGMGSVLGPLAGAAAFLLLEEGLSAITRHWHAVMGIILVLVVMFARNGLAELGARLWRRADRTS
jgi:branched-chain amino acid transport system permease protein